TCPLSVPTLWAHTLGPTTDSMTRVVNNDARLLMDGAAPWVGRTPESARPSTAVAHSGRSYNASSDDDRTGEPAAGDRPSGDGASDRLRRRPLLARELCRLAAARGRSALRARTAAARDRRCATPQRRTYTRRSRARVHRNVRGRDRARASTPRRRRRRCT